VRLERSSGRYKTFFWPRVLLIESAAEFASVREATTTTVQYHRVRGEYSGFVESTVRNCEECLGDGICCEHPNILRWEEREWKTRTVLGMLSSNIKGTMVTQAGSASCDENGSSK
jgi:hypothetical protein